MILQRTGNRTVAACREEKSRSGFPTAWDREVGRVLECDGEPSTGPGASIILYYQPNNTWRKPPHRDALLTVSEQHPILVRITAAMALLGINPVWEAIPPQLAGTDWPVIREQAKAYLRRAE
jgi:hypothetical protein